MADPFEELYETYKKMIFSYLYQLTLNTHTAEELTHDTFLKAFKSFKKFRGDSSLKTWLFTIARHTYINDASKTFRQLETNMDPSTMRYIDKKNNIDDADATMFLNTLLKQLPEKDRSLFLLRHYSGLSHKEIAAILDLTEGQTKIGIHRARKKLRELYDTERKED